MKIVQVDQANLEDKRFLGVWQKFSIFDGKEKLFYMEKGLYVDTTFYGDSPAINPRFRNKYCFEVCIRKPSGTVCVNDRGSDSSLVNSLEEVIKAAVPIIEKYRAEARKNQNEFNRTWKTNKLF